MKTNRFLLAAGVSLALAFIFSCSTDTEDNNNSQSSHDVTPGDIIPGPLCSSTNIPANHVCDDRDGKIELYKEVTIDGPYGSQIWMARNLNYNANGSFCYGDDPANCNTYGRLYDWAIAMNLHISCNNSFCSSQMSPRHKGICPSGWHIPSSEEWNILLENVVVGNKLKAANGWPGCDPFNDPYGHDYCTDEYGFSALPAGHAQRPGPYNSYEKGSYTYWWTQVESHVSISNPYYADVIKMDMTPYGFGSASKDKTYFHSIRCIKDL